MGRKVALLLTDKCEEIVILSVNGISPNYHHLMNELLKK